MTKCSNCGAPARADLAYCPNCGAALSQTGNLVADPKMAALEKPELPAWLESLRTGEHPAVPASGSVSFNGPDPIDEGALPGWMRGEHANSPEKAASDQYSARRPASMPPPQTDGEFSPPRGIAASSLIDEQALPSWMQENNPSQRSSISASSLVQPDALPNWMRNLQAPSGSTPPPVPPAVDPITPIQSLSAHNLVDQQALPAWLTGPTNAPAQPVQPQQTQQSPQVSQPPQPYQQPMYQQPGAQSGLAASSLLNMNALPNWLRENESAQGQSPSPADLGQQPFAQPGQAQPPNANGPLAAASLIDMNALPGWLRASENSDMGPTRGGNMGNPGVSAGASGVRFNSFAPPQAPRGENMRVPSRPRGEVAPYGQSEVAANVFSSMLGVASTAPSFSSQPPSQALGDAQGFLAGQSQQPMAQIPQVPSNMGYSTGNQPAWPQQPPTSGSNMMPGQGQNVPSPASKPAKRGFLETIRSWFSR